MKLKVCGLSTDADVKTCIANNVNYCGFICWMTVTMQEYGI